MSEQLGDIFDPKNNYHITSAHSGTDDSIYNIIVKQKWYKAHKNTGYR